MWYTDVTASKMAAIVRQFILTAYPSGAHDFTPVFFCVSQYNVLQIIAVADTRGGGLLTHPTHPRRISQAHILTYAFQG